MNELSGLKQDEQMEELLDLLENMQTEVEQNHPTEGSRDRAITDAASRIAELIRETEQREQSRERTGIKERLDANKRIVTERERGQEKSR